MSEKSEPIVVAQIMGKWLGGGVESVVMNYYRNIDRTKVQFDFICDSDSTNIPYEEIEKLGGRVFLVPPYQKVVSYHKELKKILKENNYSIVHSHINTLSVFSLYAAKKAGIKTRIAHSHSITSKKEFKRNIAKYILRPFSKTFATKYVACSEVAGRWMFGNKEYNKENVYILNNAIDIEKFKFNEEVRKEKRKELNISGDALVIGHVGRFVSVKNHNFIIDLFKEVHEENNKALLMLVGQGPLEEEIKEKVKKLNLESSVLFLGQRNDVSDLYNIMDIFLLPSFYEGLPVVGVEAQVNGNFCLFSNNVTKEVKISKKTYFLDIDDLSVWKKKILKSKTLDRKKEVELGKYDISKESKKLLKYYLK